MSRNSGRSKGSHRNYARYSYALLFTGASFHLDLAKQDQQGCFYHYVSAMLFSAFSVEAFLNHIGRLRFKHWDESVKRGTNVDSKFKLIASDLQLPEGDYQRLSHALRQLVSFRNKVAHADTEIWQIDSVALDRGEAPGAGWEKICTVGNAEQYVKMAKDLITTINTKAGQGEWAIYIVGQGLPY